MCLTARFHDAAPSRTSCHATVPPPNTPAAQPELESRSESQNHSVCVRAIRQSDASKCDSRSLGGSGDWTHPQFDEPIPTDRCVAEMAADHVLQRPTGTVVGQAFLVEPHCLEP